MAGRGGRGRGRGRGISINLEQIGLTRSDLIATPKSQQPPALYPPLNVQPLPLDTGENDRYMLNPQREMRETLANSPFWIKPLALKKDIVRYSDKYQVNGSTSESTLKFMDSSRFPRELVVAKRKRKSQIGVKSTAENLKKGKGSFQDVEKTLKELESKEAQENTDEVKEENAKEEEEDDDEKEVEDDEYYDEEELEEGTDYNLSYFDSGDGYLDEEEDNLDDDPVY